MIGLVFILLIAFLPLLFQISFGKSYGKVKFWHICIVSITLWFATYFINAKIISNKLEAIGSHDGMPFLGLYFIEILLGTLIVLTIILQIIVKFKKQKSLKN